MVDCGHNASTGWYPGTYLRNQGVRYLNMLAITNYDEDHVSGLPDLLGHVDVGWLWRNESVSPDDIEDLKSETGMGDGIESLVEMARSYTGSRSDRPLFEGVERRAFRNRYPDFEDENNLSMAVYLECHGIGVLFPGDLETDGWLALLENQAFRQTIARTKVLIASHHGRENGISEELFYNYGCEPFYVVISDKGYMYDTQRTIPYYSSKALGGPFRGEHRRVLTTRRDGRIGFTFSSDAWHPY